MALSAKERERLKVLHEVQRGHLRQMDAARRLRLSDRQVSRETLRKWMNAAGLRQSRRRKWKPVHVWRPRRPAFGELVT